MYFLHRINLFGYVASRITLPTVPFQKRFAWPSTFEVHLFSRWLFGLPSELVLLLLTIASLDAPTRLLNQIHTGMIKLLLLLHVLICTSCFLHVIYCGGSNYFLIILKKKYLKVKILIHNRWKTFKILKRWHISWYIL